MNRLFLLPLAVGLIAGCSHTTKIAPPVFHSEEHSHYNSNNNASLRGESFYSTVNNERITCAGQTIYLLPKTSFYKELVEADYKGLYLLKTIDPRAYSYVRTAVCDSNGRFVFEGLPDAQWIGVSTLQWNSDEPQHSKPHRPKLHQVVLIKDISSRANTTDEVYFAEADETFLLPKHIAEQNLSPPVEDNQQPIVIDGGECREEHLGKEDTLPEFCTVKKEVVTVVSTRIEIQAENAPIHVLQTPKPVVSEPVSENDDDLETPYFQTPVHRL